MESAKRFFTVSVSWADFLTGKYPVDVANFAVFSVFVANFINSYAAYCCSADTLFVINKEAPCCIIALSFPSKWGTSATTISNSSLLFMQIQLMSLGKIISFDLKMALIRTCLLQQL